MFKKSSKKKKKTQFAAYYWKTNLNILENLWVDPRRTVLLMLMLMILLLLMQKPKNISEPAAILLDQWMKMHK